MEWRMSTNNGLPEFPRTEEFVDFAGRIRTFAIEVFPVPGGHGVCASEDVEGDDGYVFRAFSTVDPFHALGVLRGRIRKLLCVRHLVEKNGRLSLTHDRLRERIAYRGVVVDGIFLTFDELAKLVQTYEGFQFDFKLVDSSDELE
jgi:hypothetical protein